LSKWRIVNRDWEGRGRSSGPLAALRGSRQELMCAVDRYTKLDGQRQTAMCFAQPTEPLGQLGKGRAASQVERQF
jgi:hypothetical protein